MTRSKRIGLFALLLAFSLLNAVAQSLPTAKPEEEGFSSERLARLDKYYADKIDKGDLAGMVILISRHGKIIHSSSAGYANIEKQQKMDRGTIFRYYSMTKAMA